MHAEEEATIVKLRSAPAPDDPAKPRWPWQLTASSWRYVLRRSWSEFWYHHILDHAGNLAYMSMQSLFPALLAIITVLTMIGQGPAAVQWMMELLETVAPAPIVDLMRELRASRARLHVREETPFFTGPRVTLPALIERLR